MTEKLRAPNDVRENGTVSFPDIHCVSKTFPPLNRLRFDKITDSLQVGTFLRHSVDAVTPTTERPSLGSRSTAVEYLGGWWGNSDKAKNGQRIRNLIGNCCYRLCCCG